MGSSFGGYCLLATYGIIYIRVKMVKATQLNFTEALEKILVSVWGTSKNYLSDSLIAKTRASLVAVREAYRYHGSSPSRINFKPKKNRAGYIAAFGQQHALLSYLHMSRVAAANPSVLPVPENYNNELVLTLVGAGMALESYGICLYYNKVSQRVKKLRLNLIDKVGDWSSNRQTMIDRLLKVKFSKLSVIPNEITVDLRKDCLQDFVKQHDSLANTDILVIYNVMNEIQEVHALNVWKNVDFLIRICRRPLLILLMEPSALKTVPRVEWIKTQLVQCADLVLTNNHEEFYFDAEPAIIGFENTGDGLYDRLYGNTTSSLTTSLRRNHLSVLVKPRSPISYEQMTKQLLELKNKRTKSGQYRRVRRTDGFQESLWHSNPDWLNQ